MGGECSEVALVGGVEAAWACAALAAALLFPFLAPPVGALVRWAWPRLCRAAAALDKIAFGWAFERRVARAALAAAWAVRTVRARCAFAFARACATNGGQVFAAMAEAAPVRSGLTNREELLAEIAALPAGPTRRALRDMVSAWVDTPYTIRQARQLAGRPRASREALALLESGVFG